MEHDTPLTSLFRITKVQERALVRLGIANVSDLLFHLPTRYDEEKEVKTIANLSKGDDVSIFGRVKNLATKKAYRKKIPLAEGELHDHTGKICLTWFNQAYIAKTFAGDPYVKITGKIGERGKTLYIANPLIEKVASTHHDASSLFESKKGGTLVPTYRESRGITSLWFYHAIKKLFAMGALEKIEDPLPQTLLKKYNLPTLKTALVWIHTPQNKKDHLAARKRFSFQEIFFIQLARLSTRHAYKQNHAHQVDRSPEKLDAFTKRLPFSPTNAQNRALADIAKDLAKNEPMSRLLEGDVGSGKTFVAAGAAYLTTLTHPEGRNVGNLQTAYMVPTEILAKQHFESFIENFAHLGINIGLITGSECRKFPSKVDPKAHTHISRAQLLKWVANGEIPILVGTHTLIQKTVSFAHLALVIIDEQHRFGVMQRARLAKKGADKAPHLLSMTATPIPRTLALTIYGDLDLTLLDEMPKGRRQIETHIVPQEKRGDAYKHIREELKKGRQAYVICPRIDEPDPEKAQALRVTSAVSEHKRLQEKVFPEFNVGLVHSKLKPQEKERVMNAFTQGSIDVLTSTSVVEVGVNVPNATMIVIEGAERFGLAQLHQLRGRVLRSTHQAYCYIFSDTKNKKAKDRLNALITAKNGFALAELDLSLRGEGTLSGEKQWGVSDVGMDAIKNIKMVEAARKESQALLEKDPHLQKHPLIRGHLKETEAFHFE